MAELLKSFSSISIDHLFGIKTWYGLLVVIYLHRNLKIIQLCIIKNQSRWTLEKYWPFRSRAFHVVGFYYILFSFYYWENMLDYFRISYREIITSVSNPFRYFFNLKSYNNFLYYHICNMMVLVNNLDI